MKMLLRDFYIGLSFIQILFMNTHDTKLSTGRRQFLGKLSAGAASLGLASMLLPYQRVSAETQSPAPEIEPEEWFKKIKGKHRMIFDVPKTNEILPFAWPRVFIMTNMATGSAASDINAVVVFRHSGIPFAFNNDIWAKYNFGQVFKVDDPATKAPATKNPFWKPAKGTYKVPGLGVIDIGIDELQESGAMFCVCDVAMTLYSAAISQGMNLDPAEAKKEWIGGLLPGVQIMPSGVWAVGRAQEHGCNYCFAG
jgi:hypothetical protein